MIKDRFGKKVLFLTLSPDKATSIINGGLKTIIKPDAEEIQKGDIVIIYAGLPVEQIVGSCTVESSLEAKYTKLIKEYGLVSDIAFSKPKNQKALAINLKNPIPMYNPISLSEIKTILPGFAPPKSCKQFTYSQFINLMNSSVKYSAIS
jgi:predicted transcriptional regulator